MSNGAVCNKGSRIILGWNEGMASVMLLSYTDQVMHVQVNLKEDNKAVFVSFVYASNHYIERRQLWEDLRRHKVFTRNNPWIISGDFNAALFLDDSTNGSSNFSIAMREFRECVDDIGVGDVNSTGLKYTWNQKPSGLGGTLKKIDRVLGNADFGVMFPDAYVLFQPYRISDHAPSILKVNKVSRSKPKPFKFVNMLAYKPQFVETVKAGWDVVVEGHNMFRLVKRLRLLKKPMRKLLISNGHVHDKVTKLRVELDQVQREVDADPHSTVLREELAAYTAAFLQASVEEERFLKQKAKIDWLKEGDSNTKYFHKTVKAKNSWRRINCIQSEDGSIVEGNAVPQVFVKHFETFLGTSEPVSKLDMHSLFQRRLDRELAENMVKPVSNVEIREAVFSMGNDKAPGPDGYSALFFKKSWDVIGDDFCKAVADFFTNGRLLQEVNHTIIALLPKTSSPSKVTEYRPISCCNIIYKCISKILTNRLKVGLDSLVSSNQSAFIPGRSISDNILLTQELMHNYHINRGPPRCAFKIDIQKAYDTVNWDFLRDILMGFGFHPTFVEWIMTCISSASFSLSINGDLHGYFKGRRGLRQGDPMSPYLFTLVMEILTLILRRRIRASDTFEYHNKCSKQKIVNVCFADDLLIFARGCKESVSVIMESLDEFKSTSGLVPSLPKSVAFFCNVSNSLKEEILDSVLFAEGKLPIRYLGVPLITTRLRHRDCQVLVERVQNRINDWKNKWLSFAGRVQLVISVLSSMHLYWASMFVLPASIIHDIEQQLNRFLWSQGELKKGKVKVKWDDVCLPKEEGGLGIRKLAEFNIALMSKHIWNIITRKETLWVRWIHSYKLKKQSFWEVKLTANVSWSWRKLLQMRSQIREFFWFKIGNGNLASAWFDTWDLNGPLCKHISPRSIYNAGFDASERLVDIVVQGNWSWPIEWTTRYPNINNITVPIFSGTPDRLCWKDFNGVIHPFSVARAWESIRTRGAAVNWSKIVWSSNAIPRHSAHMWLICRRRLKTQDRLRQWDVGAGVDLSSLRCWLCKSQLETHEHLFFLCPYSQKIWDLMLDMAHLPKVGPDLSAILDWLRPLNLNKIVSIVGRLLVAASSYYIWQERNGRLHGNDARNEDTLARIIADSVRLKLVTIRFKKKEKVLEMKRLWRIPWYEESC